MALRHFLEHHPEASEGLTAEQAVKKFSAPAESSQ